LLVLALLAGEDDIADDDDEEEEDDDDVMERGWEEGLESGCVDVVLLMMLMKTEQRIHAGVRHCRVIIVVMEESASASNPFHCDC
jgi:hypothetical protein